MNTSAIPAELLALGQMVAWRPERRGEKMTKIPVNPRTGGQASTTDPATWGTFTEADAAASTIVGGGIGFVFATNDGYTGVDLDACRDPETGEIETWAQAIINGLDSYTEISPSGRGVHIIVKAIKPGEQCKVTQPHIVEVYDAARFFTLTGDHLEGTPTAPQDRQDELADLYRRLFPEVAPNRLTSPRNTISLDDSALIDKAMGAKNGQLFRALWNGDTSAHNGDDSAADLALCSLLMFWTGNDPARTDRLFRRSGLYRAKWERSDYRAKTMEKARATEVYTEPRTRTEPNGVHSAEPTPIRPDARGGDIDRKLNEVANAARFVRQHGDRVRYCKSLDTWFIWDGTRWQADTRGAVMELAKATAARIYHEAADAPEAMRDEVAKWARRSHFRAGLTAMVALAESDPAVAILDTDLDRDRWVLNCMNGTLDLRTGILRPHNPPDLITKRAPVIYDPDATLPLWDAFIATTTGGKEDFASFLRRAAGATLVGENLDEVMFLPHGGGGGGKSTFLESLKGTLGEYAKTADFETFIKKRGDAGIRNDIARLAGARLVVSIEVDEGKHLAMALLKTLTGGEDTAARFLYKEATESRPTYSLWLAANHAPTVRSDDDAAWRRILRLPFTHLVPKEKRDPAVKATLRNPDVAGAAILAWAVRGCLEWQRDGLNVPALVEQATEQFRHEMNPINDWVDEYCDLSPQAWTPTAQLWKAYQTYAHEEGGARGISKQEFTEYLKALGCEPVFKRPQGKPARGWRGIAFKDGNGPRGDALPIDPEGDPPDNIEKVYGYTGVYGSVGKVEPCIPREEEVTHLGVYPRIPVYDPPEPDNPSREPSVNDVNHCEPKNGVVSRDRAKFNLPLNTVHNGSHRSHDPERPLAADDLPDRVALRQWADDEALGWENRTFPEAAIREATRRYYALTIPPTVPRDEMAKMILAAMKGLPQTKGRAQ